MKAFIFSCVLFSHLTYGQSLKRACHEWRSLASQLSHLTQSNLSQLQGAWMSRKGFGSSQFLVVSNKEQHDFSLCHYKDLPIYKNYLVCSEKGVEKAQDYALREKGSGFYLKITAWNAPTEEKFWKQLNFPRGLKNPTQIIHGTIGGAFPYEFNLIWSSYLKVRNESVIWPHTCSYKDYRCIRSTHASVTKLFLNYLKLFPEVDKAHFKKKINALNKVREARWSYEDI